MTVATTSVRQEPIWTRDFIILCGVTFGIMSGMAFLMPVLALLVKEVGGSTADIGLVVSSFALTSVILRPFLGRLVDRRGGKIVLMAGCAMLLVASALYLVVHSVPVLLALRVFHGMGMGAATTAIWALAAELAPPNRRGEAMGWFGMFMSSAFAVGPLLGGLVLDAAGFTGLFWVLTAVTLVGLLLSTTLHQAPRPVHHAALPSPPLLSTAALLPAIIFLVSSTTFAAITSFLPLLVQERGVGSAAIFFSLQSVMIFLGRMAGGSLSDRFGRVFVIIPSGMVLIIGMVTLAFATNQWVFLLAAMIHGLGAGAGQPAQMAMAVDRAPERERGAAMATTTTAMDLGFALSAVPLGWVLERTDFTTMYLTPAALMAAGLVLFGLLVRREAARKAPVLLGADRERVTVS